MRTSGRFLCGRCRSRSSAPSTDSGRGWIAARTAQVNTLRGLLREYGIVTPEGIEKVIPQVRLFLADADSGIPDSLRATVAAACDEIESLGA